MFFGNIVFFWEYFFGGNITDFVTALGNICFFRFFLVGINLFRGDIIVCFGNRTFIGNIVS